MRATLIIPQYNRPHLTRDCLRSIVEHETAPVEIIVVDDGSAPAALTQIQSLNIPNTRIIAQPHSGVSAAWSRGAKAAASPNVVFLNNDTLFHGPVIDRLLEPLESRRICLTGVAMRREAALPPSIVRNLPTGHFLEGWCFAVARGDFQSLGGFDESMALYWSDTDFQARLLQHRPGSQLHAVPGLPISHRAHQTARHLPSRRAIWKSDRATFIKKWTPPACALY